MGWDKSIYIPPWDMWNWGKLDWNNNINPLASGIKCASMVTTVSPNYLEELKFMSNGLEPLFEFEKGKCVGILNGIDSKVWDPQTDSYLTHHYGIKDNEAGKAKNKMELCERFNLDFQKPLISFIGRLVGEKGADVLPSVIGDSFWHVGRRMNFLILGSGNYQTERELERMLEHALGDYNVYIGYNEALSHLMYAGSDFLLMPSRTGGLKDTVIDFEEPGGYGICYNHTATGDICQAVWRGVELYHNKKKMNVNREKMMQLDFDWKTSTQKYIRVYEQLIK
jgi:starch synthase